MNKEFVPYELAVKLKELGFDEPCFGYYDNGVFIFWYDSKQETELLLNCTASTFSQAFRWFRKKYMLVGVPTHQSYDIWNTITGECFIEIYPLNSYEEAELACLTKLIEIVEQQNI